MRKTKNSVLFTILNILILIGCSGPNTSIFGPTITPSHTPSPTPTNCPPVILDRNPVLATIRPYLIVVLFEDAPNFRSQNNQDIEMLRNVFRENAEPGDYILMMRMEPLTLSSATFFQQKIGLVSPPPIPPLPTMYPTFTPVPSPTAKADTTIAQTAESVKITAAVTASVPTATFQAFLHQCAMNEWEKEYQATQTSYENETQVTINEFLEYLQPISSTPIPSTAVWSGLEKATLVMSNECENYYNCILVIFSDMDEIYTDPTGKNVYLPLQNNDDQNKVQILVAMRDCLFLFTGSCSRWKSYWEDFFLMRSTRVEFVNSNVNESIEALIRR